MGSTIHQFGRLELARPSRVAAVAVSTAALTLAGVSPAIASSNHGHASFKVTGIVTAVHDGKVRVLAQSARVGRHAVADHLLTLRLQSSTRKHGVRTLAAGDSISATGTEDGNRWELAAVTAAPQPARALIGTIAGVSGNLVTLTSRDQVDGNSTEHHQDEGDRPLVDVSNATFSGVATSAAGLAAGQVIVVLGERTHHVMSAAKVYSFSAMPSLAVGEVTASDPASKSLTVTARGSEGDHEGDGTQQQPEATNSPTPSSTTSPDATATPDTTPTPQPTDTAASESPDASPSDTASADSHPDATSISVDASNADVVINGNDQQQAETFPATGDKVLVVGAPGASPASITASLVCAFNGHDRGGVGHNDD